jgi:hypothetical protein
MESIGEVEWKTCAEVAGGPMASESVNQTRVNWKGAGRRPYGVDQWTKMNKSLLAIDIWKHEGWNGPDSCWMYGL